MITGMEAELRTRTTVQTFATLVPMFAYSRFVWVMCADSFATLYH